MRTKHLPTKILFVGILGIAVGGCGASSAADDAGGAESSGGAAAGGAGGSATTGGTGPSTTGGTTSTGGTTGQPVTGGTTSTGGSTASGGARETGGQATTGGRSGGRGGAGGSAAGGTTGSGGGVATGGSTSTDTCTASKATGTRVSGTGPHKVVVESNSGAGISCGTIYRPEELGGADKYPIFVWANGACTRNGLSNQAAMAEIASWGYFVVADGPPGGGGDCGTINMGALDVMSKPMLDYITWAIAENDKGCSAYYQSLDTTKVAADGFSCGGLMAEGTGGDPRMTTWGITSSGGANQAFYKTVHTPVKVLVGGPNDIAYENGLRDYEALAALGIPILFFSQDDGVHGGDLRDGRGNFNTINLAWLNWQLKGDEGETGKALLIGPSCKYCNATGWEFKSANIE
jgi:hypothetical protein